MAEVEVGLVRPEMVTGELASCPAAKAEEVIAENVTLPVVLL